MQDEEESLDSVDGIHEGGNFPLPEHQFLFILHLVHFVLFPQFLYLQGDSLYFFMCLVDGFLWVDGEFKRFRVPMCDKCLVVNWKHNNINYIEGI